MRSNHENHLDNEDGRHWLDEGELGRECLFDDLDPFLYAIDRAIATKASQIAHSYDGEDEKPRALLAPPVASVPWQIGNLSRHYRVEIWVPDPDDLVERAAEAFDAHVLVGEIPDELVGMIDLFLVTNTHWENHNHFLLWQKEALPFLAEDGELCVVLRSVGEGGLLSVSWDDGSETLLTDLVSLGPEAKRAEFKTICLPEFAPDKSSFLTDFLHRHRQFFGRNARDLCLTRMHEDDFQAVFSPQQKPRWWVTMLSWALATSERR